MNAIEMPSLDDPKALVDWATVRDRDSLQAVAKGVDRAILLRVLELVVPRIFDNQRGNTPSSYCSDIAHFLAWCITRGLRLSVITSAHVSQYILDRTRADTGKLGPRSVNRNLVSINWLFVYLTEFQPAVQANNPVKRRHHFRNVEKHEPKPLRFRSAMEFVSKMPSLTDRALFSFMLFTGCRECEMTDIRFCDTSLLQDEGKEILEVTITSKGDYSRKTYLAGPALETLREYSEEVSRRLNRGPEDRDLLLSNHSGLSWKPRRIRKRFAKLQETLASQIDTSDWTPYRFRHTLLSAMGEAEMSIFSMQAISGHKDINSLLFYVEARESKTRAAYHLATRKLCE